MGTIYVDDRNFTDIVHNKLAIPFIYNKLGWEPLNLDIEYATKIDIEDGIDYKLIDRINGREVSVQERFRDSGYFKYTDFTIRFERPYNMHEERKLSEYYKLKADYFVYGIIDTNKSNVSSATGFIKFAVVDLKVVNRLIEEGKIIINRRLYGRCCKMINGIMNCPVNSNHDGSSVFFPIDINFLLENFSEYNAVLYQEGF